MRQDGDRHFKGCPLRIEKADCVLEALRRLVYAASSRNIYPNHLEFERALADARKIVDDLA
jgi:hypothetical protein